MVTTARRQTALLSLVLIAILATAFGRPAAAQIPYTGLLWSEPRYSAVVVDANTGEVLYAKRPDSPRYPASITKIMTLYLTFEALAAGRLSLSDTVTVSYHAASMAPSKLGLSPGQTITVDEAIRAVAVKSANDMAVALAERIGGSEQRFAALMTLRAQELGMTNSQFVNASGLPDTRQLTTARDIAVLSRSVMRDYPQYYSYFGLRQFAYRGEVMNNHNHLLDSMPGVDGLKTGFINASGFNLAASAVRDGRRLIAVVLGGSSTAARDNNVQDLLTVGFDVLRRRDRGETVTVAQNLFEPEASGPIQRPATEQGDGDQQGLKIVMGRNLPIAIGPTQAEDEFQRVRPATFVRVAQAKPCATAREVRTVRRHGRRVKVSASVRRCEGAARLTPVADVRPCKAKAKRGHHAKAARCETSPSLSIAKAERRHGRKASRIASNAGDRSEPHATRSRGNAPTREADAAPRSDRRRRG